MAGERKPMTPGQRVRAKEALTIGDLTVSNQTENSIMVSVDLAERKVEVTDCCLEEQGK